MTMTWLLVIIALLFLAVTPVAVLLVWSRITALERRIRHTERALGEIRAQQWAQSPPVVPPTEHPPRTAPPPVREAAFSPPAVPSTSPDPVPEPAAGTRRRAEWETLVGGKLLNRIGALALIIGVGFFLKYAFDHEWIAEPVRVLVGAAAGVSCLAAAWRSHARGYAVFAQGLVGAGIAVLYLSVYASFNFYQLVPQVVAFGLMSLVTLIAFHQAHRYDALAVALLAWAGGYLTPVLLHTGAPNAAGLFTYIALLTAGILALVAVRDTWFILYPLSLIATYVLYIAWFLEAYEPAMFPLTLFFLVIFWGLFAAIDVAHIVQMSGRLLSLKNILAGANALFFAASLHRLMDLRHHDVLAPALLLSAGVYAAMRGGLHERLAGTPSTAHRLEVTTALLLVFATGVQFDGATAVILWSLEALVLALIASGRGSAPLGAVSSGVHLLALLRFFAGRGTLGAPVPLEFAPLLNERTLAGAVLAATLLRSAGVWNRPLPGGSVVARALETVGVIVLFTLVTVEISDLFALLTAGNAADPERLEYLRLLAYPVGWMALALAMLAAGLRRTRPGLPPTALVIAALAVVSAPALGIAYEPLLLFRPVLNERVLALALMIAGVALAGWLLRGTPTVPWARGVAGIAGPVMVVFALVALTGEIRDTFEQAMAVMRSSGMSGDGELAAMQDRKQLALSGAWLLFSIILMGGGIGLRHRTFRLMAIVLFGCTILKIFIYDLSFLDTLYRIFSFVGLGVILLVVSWLYQRFRDRIT